MITTLIYQLLATMLESFCTEQTDTISHHQMAHIQQKLHQVWNLGIKEKLSSR